jgi:RNA polymerase sigma-70 factor (ECF subfamily)
VRRNEDLRVTLRPESASALVQEAFLRAVRSPAAIPVGRSGEEAWLVRVLVNIRRDQWRRAAVRDRRDLSGSEPAVHNGHETASVARATVWRALDILSPRRRAVLVLHEIEERSVSDIASLLGITTITVRWHLSKGRRELARKLRPIVGEIDENH